MTHSNQKQAAKPDAKSALAALEQMFAYFTYEGLAKAKGA